ncbi:hypothetical protein SCLCIDRAFT_1210898 [Scleroderma citrinum Foug A]|uniref:Uncharacterized protein n=1 Tax=Scleroderma citrinum Foug A TaxID=1036808 RepID=A0A0C3E209_9AGAM|nr:hypothetical protein SCLCIDRAFT_1210898 [Scleroderma citrinum Foug A]
MSRRGGTVVRYRGLSKSIISHHYKGRTQYSTVLTAAKQAERLERARAKRFCGLKEMSAADQDAAAQMSADQDMGKGFPRSSVAPGDETFTLPHKGGEHEAFEDPAQQVADVHGVRQRHDHVELQTIHPSQTTLG